MKASNLVLTAAVAMCAAVLVAVSESGAEDHPQKGGEGAGQALYRANCGGCHQADGGGVPMMQPELIGSARANGNKGGVIEMILLGSVAIEPGMSDYSNEMPSFGHLSDTEIALIATYVRTHFENTGGSVTADDVRTLRPK